MLQEALAERRESLLDTGAEVVQRADARTRARAGTTSRATRSSGCSPSRQAALVAEHVQQREVGEALALEERLEVNAEVALPGEAVMVAQEPQLAAVRDQAPQVVVGPIQEVLDQAMRAHPCGAGHLLGAVVQRHACAEEMDGHAAPAVRKGVVAGAAAMAQSPPPSGTWRVRAATSRP